MRAIALAAIVGAALTGVAAAEPWTDPAGRLTFNKPPGWQVENQGASDQATIVLAFNASNDCYFFGLTNPASANSSPDAARRAAPLTNENWIAAASAGALRRDFFPNGTPQLVSSSVDTSGFWPIQRAQFQGARTVFAAVQTRPGFELRAFCAATSGGSAASFEAIFASFGHPNDAAWQSQAQDQAAERQAAAAAAAQQQQQPQEQQAQEQPEADGANDGVERTSRDPRSRRRRN
jgi:hypothetical protein